MLNWFAALTKTINSNTFPNMTSSSNNRPVEDIFPTPIGNRTATAEELLTLPMIKNNEICYYY